MMEIQPGERPPCHCGTGHCQPKILHSILSYHMPGAAMSGAVRLADEHNIKHCQRSVLSPSGSTGSCYNSPRHSPASSPNPAASPASPSPDSKLFRLLNVQRTASASPSSPAGPEGHGFFYSNRAVPSPGAASTCSVNSDAYPYHSSPEPDQHQPLNLKRPFQPVQTGDQPIDLSCKKRRRLSNSTSSSYSIESGLSYESIKREVPSPFTGADSLDNNNQSSILKSILSGQTRSSRVSSPLHDSFPPSPVAPRDSNATSILSGILQQARLGVSPVMDGSQAGSRCSTPGSTGAPSYSSSQSGMQLQNKNTAVALAKKNLFPVTARVSDWLVKIVHFAKCQPEFINLPHNDQISLMLHSWARVMLLFMAENGFEFAVTPKYTPAPSSPSDVEDIPNPNTPTTGNVEQIQRFISKCQKLNLDQQEYTYLKMIALFHPGYFGVESSEYIDSVNSLVRQSLQRHIQAAHPNNKMRYSQLLMALPTLFSVNCKVMENLFCRHIIGDADMEVLLKEMLQKL